MFTLPETIIAILASFAPLFSTPVFRHVQVLVAGTLLTSGRHTVTNALRMMGLGNCTRFQCYHRVLNRAKWNPRHAAKILLRLLVTTLVPEREIVTGIDETLERRRGKKITAKGIYRDSVSRKRDRVRSSKGFFVKSSGLRWIRLMLFASIPWAKRIWALPFLTVLAPSERYHKERGRRHKTIVDWARQMARQLRRSHGKPWRCWLPGRTIVLIGDDAYSVLDFLDSCRRMKNPVTVVTRLRLDAALYETAPERKAGQMGRPRVVGDRLPRLEAVSPAPFPTLLPPCDAKFGTTGFLVCHRQTATSQNSEPAPASLSNPCVKLYAMLPERTIQMGEVQISRDVTIQPPFPA